MKLHASLLLSFLLITCLGRAQGSAGFTDFSLSESHSTQQVPVHSPTVMFDRYLLDHFGLQPIANKSVFILIPENGCPFCVGKMVEFYKNKKTSFQNLKLIVVASTSTSGIDSDMKDVGGKYKSYGFDHGFPVVGFAENHKTLEVIQIDSQRIERQMEDISLFLGE